MEVSGKKVLAPEQQPPPQFSLNQQYIMHVELISSGMRRVLSKIFISLDVNIISIFLFYFSYYYLHNDYKNMVCHFCWYNAYQPLS